MVFSRKKEIPKKYFGEDKIKFNKFNNKKPDHVDKNKKFEYKSRTGIYNNINNKNKKNNSINNNINSVKIIPLGGLDEIGKNMTLIEYENDIVIIDCGLAFPDNEMLGVDIVIPDFSYVVENKNKIRGIVVTHGHEDHIGGLAYLFKEISDIPVYGTQLTLGLIEGKLKEHRLLNSVELRVVKPRDIIRLGKMKVEFVAVNHSIPDACAMVVTTPVGVIVHTGDFKIDYTPINGHVIDLSRFSQLGEKGVLALLSDSTNSERPGMTVSEKKISESFEILFRRADGKRMIIATFASNIHRIQQIMDAAIDSGRKVAVSGRSMENVVSKAIELGYLKVPRDTIISIDKIKNYPDEKLIIITTGSQGEPMSALRRMATGDHKKVMINSNDFIIISATPIPGNEKFVNRVVNDLMKLGAEVIYEDMYDVHVSGHACQSEQQMIINLVKPKYFLPVHGEYKHLKRHAQTAINMGIDPSNVHVGSIGEVIEVSKQKIRVSGLVPAGNVMVDGLGIGDVGNIVLKDRKHLSEDGLIVVSVVINKNDGSIVLGPDIVSRGFIYVRESEDLVRETRKIAMKALNRCATSKIREWSGIKLRVKDDISDFLYAKTKRNPMILVILQDIDL